MEKDQFKKDFGKLLNDCAHYATGNSYRTLTDGEFATFLDESWTFLNNMQLSAQTIDYTSPPFFYALQRAQRRYDSVQMQLSVLGEYIVEEIQRAKQKPKS